MKTMKKGKKRKKRWDSPLVLMRSAGVPGKNVSGLRGLDGRESLQLLGGHVRGVLSETCTASGATDEADTVGVERLVD